MRPCTEPDNTQTQRREDSNIKQCINHGPSTESRLPFEGLICRAWEIFPVADSASDDHYSLALLMDSLLVAQP
jgi:hypothetical protein